MIVAFIILKLKQKEIITNERKLCSKRFYLTSRSKISKPLKLLEIDLFIL